MGANSQNRGDHRAAYRVYFLDENDHIFSAQNFKASDDAAAIGRAQEFFVSAPACWAVEIWQEARQLHRLCRPNTAGPAGQDPTVLASFGPKPAVAP